MDRRQFNISTARALALMSLAGLAQAQDLSRISNTDASAGLKSALERGATAAVNLLGKPDGFLANPKVHIPLPGFLKDAAKFMKALGQGKQLEELEVTINRAAEAAVPLARQLLIDAVKGISVADAKKILTGGETSVTTFFADKTRAPLSERFLPVVTQAVAKVGLAEKYNQVAKKVSGTGLVKSEDASIEHYVTRKTLDGLYLMIGEEEKKIRQDPVGTGSALLQKVFGAMK